jgi:hypothetical protein
MEGQKEATRDGKTTISWAFRPSLESSDRRLAETRDVRTAP